MTSQPSRAATLPPSATARWRNASGHHVSAEDTSAATALNLLAAQGTNLARRAPAVLAMMRDHQTGQPQAAHYGPDEDDPDDDPDRQARARLWCWEHEQNAARCDEDRIALAERGIDQNACPGVQLTGPSDPAGNAAMATDRARADRLEFVAAIGRAKAAFDRAWSIAEGWPTVPMTPEDGDAGPGDELCRAHHKCNKYPEPITRRTTGAKAGQRYYRYLCKWCGEQRKALGGDRFDADDPRGDPPTWYVEHHINGTVRAGMAEKAKRQVEGAWDRSETAKRARAKAAAKAKRKRK